MEITFYIIQVVAALIIFLLTSLCLCRPAYTAETDSAGSAGAEVYAASNEAVQEFSDNQIHEEIIGIVIPDPPASADTGFDADYSELPADALIFPVEDPSQETDTYPDESASVIIQDNIETPPDVPETDPGSDQPVDPVFFPTPVPGAADPIAPDGLLSLLNEETNQPGQDTNTGTDPVPSEAEALQTDTSAVISGYSAPSALSGTVQTVMTKEQKLLSLRMGFQKCPDPVPAICSAENWTGIYMAKSPQSRLAGRLYPGYLCYILTDENEPWVYVESGNVRGFVFSYYLLRGEETNAAIEAVGEENILSAQEAVDPLENSAYRYCCLTNGDIPTAASSLTGVSYAGLSPARQTLLEYAASFAGSPYVWGGDDPHTGADCSGFARYVYSQFGIELPRVAEDQAMVGQRINVSDALPGDLVFMMDSSGYIYHVVIYAGNGMTIEAKGRNNGIGSWPLDYSHACWAVRLIEDQNTDCRTPVIPEGAAIVTHDNLDIVLLDMK